MGLSAFNRSREVAAEIKEGQQSPPLDPVHSEIVNNSDTVIPNSETKPIEEETDGSDSIIPNSETPVEQRKNLDLPSFDTVSAKSGDAGNKEKPAPSDKKKKAVSDE